MDLKPVSLPFEDISILQDTSSQAISSDSEFLYRTIVSEYQERGKSPVKALELGTGNGIVSIMLALAFENWQISALEAQIPLFMLAKQNIISTAVRIDLHLADLRQIKPFTGLNTFDLIYANPPYYSPAEVRLSPSITRSISRYELLCDMDDLLNCLKRNLHRKGWAYILYPASRAIKFRNKASKSGMKISKEFSETSRETTDERKNPKIIFKICLDPTAGID